MSDNEIKTQLLPNPLEIEFGDGRISIRQFTDNEGKCGLIFKDTFTSHEIGSRDGETETYHGPEKGEVYLSFSTPSSLNVVIEELQSILTPNIKE